MTEQKQPVIIDQQSDAPRQERKSSYIKDSGDRIQSIANTYGLNALLLNETPEKTLLERALVRERQRKELQQKNLEQIIKVAYASCKKETAGDPDQDWLQRFFDLAKDIHNTSMQKLWAQVLKREVTNPGSTSMKALKILKDMTPKEAQILQRAASLSCYFGADNSRKLLLGLKTQGGIFSFSRRVLTNNLNIGHFHLNYSSLLILFELGIMHATELESGEIGMETPLSLGYQGKHLSLQAQAKGVHLLYYRFTPTGNELCKLLGNKPNMQYYDELVALLNQKFAVQTDVQSTMHHTV